MISIGVIARGKYGRRLIQNIKKNSNFRILSIEFPEVLPEFIEEPEEFIASLDLDKRVFRCELVIAYTLHPDLTPEIVRLSGENRACAVIIAGGISRAGGHEELSRLADKYDMHVKVHEICCDMEKCGDPVLHEFTSCFGRPEVKITIKDSIISNVEVVRSAPCGSTWHMAGSLIGSNTEDAPAKGGLLVQQYPCRAVRGKKGGIHKAAELHKKAVEIALKEATYDTNCI
jgi:hypothetical protein